jgi:hypothetical protein
MPTAREQVVGAKNRLPVCLSAALWGIAVFPPAWAQTAAANPPLQPELHDGRHDFDFEVGSWRAHVRKLMQPLSNSKEWDEFDGTVVTRTLPMLEGWNESEMRVDSPRTHRHIELLALRLYNPTSHQWSIYGSSINTGVFDPPQIGQFNDGHGEFFASDTWQGRAIIIRYMWQAVSREQTHFEQAFSQDGGKTWEINWIYDGTRAVP